MQYRQSRDPPISFAVARQVATKIVVEAVGKASSPWRMMNSRSERGDERADYAIADGFGKSFGNADTKFLRKVSSFLSQRAQNDLAFGRLSRFNARAISIAQAHRPQHFTACVINLSGNYDSPRRIRLARRNHQSIWRSSHLSGTRCSKHVLSRRPSYAMSLNG
jgi:hypothetical protein